MASPAARVTFRLAIVALILLFLFYMGRPLYWKISATIHEIRENRQTVKQGLSQIVLEAQKTVGWYHDESDSGAREDRVAKKVGLAKTRRLLLLHQVHIRSEKKATKCSAWNDIPSTRQMQM